MTDDWIPCNEEMPMRHEMVLAIGVNVGPRKDHTTDMWCCWMDGDRWIRWGSQPFRPTHWMPLPEPPKG